MSTIIAIIANVLLAIAGMLSIGGMIIMCKMDKESL